MFKIQGSVIKEQGITFAIVVVKPEILQSHNKVKANDFQMSCKRIFGNIPIILMAQDSSGVPTYYGRTDIVRFLANIYPSRIPWKEYTVA